MNLRDLEYLYVLSQLRHFGRAAAACNVSQPTLSMQIRKLEKTLDVPLVERGGPKGPHGGGVALTPAGREIARHAETVLAEAQAIRHIARQQHDPLAGTLTLGGFPTLAPFLFPRLMPRLKAAYPRLRLFLVEEKTQDLIAALRAGTLDLALLAMPVEANDLVHVPVLQESFRVALSTENPLSKKKAIPLEDLRQETLLLLEDAHCLTGQALDVCAWARRGHAEGFHATSLETLRQMVASNLGVTLVPEMATEIALPSLAYRPLAGAAQAGRRIGLYWRKSSPFGEAFKKLAKEIAAPG